MSGARSYHRGRTAEAAVADRYVRAGHTLRETRWRGQGGEIDLILEKDGRVVFVEVKAARSREAAAARIAPAQAARIAAAAEEYLAGLPRGGLTESRIDVALVDGAGRISIVQNALSG